MGLAVTLGGAIFFAMLAIMGKRFLVYAFLFLFVFFEEMGTGFTSFNASFVFNQNFADLFGFKFIEIVTAAAYIPLVLTSRHRGVPVTTERRLCWAFIALIIFLLFLETFLHNSANVMDWRLILSGIMLFHIIVLLVDTEEKLVSLFKVFVVMLSIRALIGLVAYWAGYGIMSPRGMVPFFWDSRQVDAFAFGIILLTAYLANFGSLRIKDKLLPILLVIVMLTILTLTVLLSLRRTVWFITLLGVVMILASSRQIKITQLIGLGFIAFIGLLLALTLPGMESFRDRMGTHFSSVNLFDTQVASSLENDVHLDNVQKYTKMILENPSVLTFGYRGYPGPGYTSLPLRYSDKYPLGVAHNAILRTVHFYGIGGLLIYLSFYGLLLMQRGAVKRLPDNRLVKHIAVASLVFLLFEFGSALTLVPPFFTTCKGLFFTFLPAFIVRAAIFHCNQTKNENSSHPNTHNILTKNSAPA